MQLVDPLSMGHFRLIPEALLRAITKSLRKSFIHHFMTGRCNFGKLNYFLGARAAREGRKALFPTVDFCKDPGVSGRIQEVDSGTRRGAVINDYVHKNRFCIISILNFMRREDGDQPVLSLIFHIYPPFIHLLVSSSAQARSIPSSSGSRAFTTTSAMCSPPMCQTGGTRTSSGHSWKAGLTSRITASSTACRAS